MKIKIFQYKPVEQPVEEAQLQQLQLTRPQPPRRRFCITPLIISLLLATLGLFIVVLSVQDHCLFSESDDAPLTAEEVELPDVIVVDIQPIRINFDDSDEWNGDFDDDVSAEDVQKAKVLGAFEDVFGDRGSNNKEDTREDPSDWNDEVFEDDFSAADVEIKSNNLNEQYDIFGDIVSAEEVKITKTAANRKASEQIKRRIAEEIGTFKLDDKFFDVEYFEEFVSAEENKIESKDRNDDVVSAEEIETPENILAAPGFRFDREREAESHGLTEEEVNAIEEVFEDLRGPQEKEDADENSGELDAEISKMIHNRLHPAVLEVPCDKIKKCLADYYTVWEIDASKNLPPYVEYFHKLEDNFEHLHEFAVDLICVAQDELRGCMETEIELDSCMNVQGYMDTFGLSKLDAREYAADLRVRDFECKNQAFLKENFGCLYPTTQKRKADLDVCSSKLKQAIDEKREPCESMDEYISCSREIFISECGPKVSGFVCRLIKTAMGFNYPTCSSVFQTCG